MGPWAQRALDPDRTWSYLAPKWIFGKLKNKKGPDGAQMGPFGLRLSQNEAESIPGPYGSPPRPKRAHLRSQQTQIPQNQKTIIIEIWNLAKPNMENQKQLITVDTSKKWHSNRCNWLRWCRAQTRVQNSHVFDFEDFVLANRQEFIDEYPAHHDLIKQLTRP